VKWSWSQYVRQPNYRRLPFQHSCLDSPVPDKSERGNLFPHRFRRYGPRAGYGFAEASGNVTLKGSMANRMSERLAFDDSQQMTDMSVFRTYCGCLFVVQYACRFERFGNFEKRWKLRGLKRAPSTIKDDERGRIGIWRDRQPTIL
jgi:hypothetical protein